MNYTRPGTWLLIVVMCGILVACGSPSTRFVTGLSAEERASARRLPVYREALPEGTYRLVEPVEGYSCQITRDDTYRPSEENAIKELRRATVKVAGDAVMGIDCERLGRGQSRWGCFRAVVCRGTAVQMISVEAN